MKKPEGWWHPTAAKRTFFFMTADALLSLFTLYTALLLRFNFYIPPRYTHHFLAIYTVLTLLKIAAMAWQGQYRIVWRYFSLDDMKRVLIAHLAAYSAMAVLLYLFRDAFLPFARSVFIIDFFLSFLVLGGLRLSKRMILESLGGNGRRPTLIVGVGQGGATALKAVMLQYSAYHPEAIVAWRDPGLAGSRINNVPVYRSEELERIVRSRGIRSAIIAEPVSGRELTELFERLNALGVGEIKRLKLLGEGRERLEDLAIEDLLARESQDLDTTVIADFVKAKTVLVTGAGGSIGSEICRQALRFGARRLILVDNAEYNLYAIADELGPERTRAKLLSVTDRAKLEKLLREETPDIVIHAAAYKHVPLCEVNVEAAVENNILGVLNVIDLSIACGVGRVVNISSDKAVRPTNVMGATKRVGELYAQNVPSEKTEIVSVRFGNVLGSSGSVVPKFKAQIEAGGPVTVTHPEITRYFMLIPEACQLVLQAAAMAEGGELFILDMGEPVKIVDLARKMIRLYGKEGEVEIVYTGLRPGEKLYEELLIDEAEYKTRYASIYVAGSTHYPIEKLRQDIETLLRSDDKIDALKKIVPEYQAEREQ